MTKTRCPGSQARVVVSRKRTGPVPLRLDCPECGQRFGARTSPTFRDGAWTQRVPIHYSPEDKCDS